MPAELIIAQVITLSRQLGDRNMDMHKGIWHKTAKNCHEVRGKTLGAQPAFVGLVEFTSYEGIVGYGHIGSQLSVLAEAMGMKVIFYGTLTRSFARLIGLFIDVIKTLALGNSSAQPDLDSVLAKADFVTLHVPLSPSTENMIGDAQLAKMKQGAFLLNASRGTVVCPFY